MNELAEFALGLGLFFVGMQMVGEHLRQLSGPTFRSLVARFTSSSWAGAGLGLLFGAMMQSATGVTFILANMVTSGLIEAAASLPVILWTNVGLTSLAFVVTLDIHPLVAWGVGISGIAASLVRRRSGKQVANVLVGVGLLLLGLQNMGAAAGPSEQAGWLQSFIAHTLTSPPLAFLTGFLLAALLQSNTGATLLVITLASGKMFGLETAVMLIYGTNLGAIILRLLLSTGMHGRSLQLVHFEDLFCLASGALMVPLFYIEQWTGLPLVLAVVTAASSDIAVQLALAFLASNLLPAIVLSPLTRQCLQFLERIWPIDKEAEAAQPKYLTPRSLEDPVTAVDLIPRELARLLASVQESARIHRAGADSAAAEEQREAASAALLARIEEFTGQLALAPLQKSVAERLNVAHELTSVIGYLIESYADLRHSVRALHRFAETAPTRNQILTALDELFGAAIAAVDTRSPESVARLREQSRSHGSLIEQARDDCVRRIAAEDGDERAIARRTALLKLLGDFDLVAWTVHRLSKLLEQIATPATPQTAASRAAAAITKTQPPTG